MNVFVGVLVGVFFINQAVSNMMAAILKILSLVLIRDSSNSRQVLQ